MIKGTALAFIAPAFFACVIGCAPTTLRQSMPAEKRVGLREEAIKYLADAALASPDPIHRVHAIEALQEAAPEEGLPYIQSNLDSRNPVVSFAALMAVGTLRDRGAIEQVRLRADDSNPSVVIAALFALHRMGEQGRTGELAQFLLDNPDARVRANAALAFGRLGEKQSAKVLRRALAKKWEKDLVRLQVREALAILGDKAAVRYLRDSGYSADPNQAVLGLMYLTNANCPEAEPLYMDRLQRAENPEVRLQAALGLGRLGYDYGLDTALAHLFFSKPVWVQTPEEGELQIIRVRELAALALGAIGSPDALGALAHVFHDTRQNERVRIAAAHAIVAIANHTPGGGPYPAVQQASLTPD